MYTPKEEGAPSAATSGAPEGEEQRKGHQDDEPAFSPISTAGHDAGRSSRGGNSETRPSARRFRGRANELKGLCSRDFLLLSKAISSIRNSGV